MRSECLLRHRAARRRGEHKLVGGQLEGLVEQFKGAVRQRHAVLAAVLHAFGGDGPQRPLAVDLVPPRVATALYRMEMGNLSNAKALAAESWSTESISGQATGSTSGGTVMR